MNDFINAVKKDLQVQIEIRDMLDKYNRLPYKLSIKNRM